MQLFRTACKVLARHRIYILIYVVSISLMGLFVTLGYVGEEADLSEYRCRVAVIDRDGSKLSTALSDYLATFSVGAWDADGELTPVEDDPQAIADVVAQDMCSYVLILPQGFGHDFMDAAVAGADVPQPETVISYASGDGAIMDLRCRQYLQAVYGFAATIAQGDQVRASSLALEAMDKRAEVEGISVAVEGVSARLVGYFAWCTYPLFTAATVLISVLMASLNATDVRRRTLAAPTSTRSRSLQVFVACLVASALSWAWMVGLGIEVDGVEVLATNGPQVALMCLALLAYALVSASFGFLVGQLGLSEPAANAIGNVGGMIFSFLGGAWMPFDLLGEDVRAVARLTPSYWAGSAVNAARDMATVSWNDALPALGACGMCALFGLVFAVLAFAIARQRTRD